MRRNSIPVVATGLMVALSVAASPGTVVRASDASLETVIEAAWAWSDIVFVGRITKLGACPPSFSGGFVEHDQAVTYSVEDVFKGSLQQPSVRIVHPIVKGTASVRPDEPCLQKGRFHIGNRLVVFARWEENRGVLAAYHPDFGAIDAEPEIADVLEEMRRDCVLTKGSATKKPQGGSTFEPGMRSSPEGTNRSSPPSGTPQQEISHDLLKQMFGPDTEIERSLVSPDGNWIAVQVDNGIGHSTIVAREGSSCPPVIVSSRGFGVGNAGATSAIWLGNDRLAFIDDEASSYRRDFVYVFRLADSALQRFPTLGIPIRVYLEGDRLMCKVRKNGTQTAAVEEILRGIDSD